MEIFKIILTEKAEADFVRHKESGNKIVLRKITALLSELEKHPHIGTGNPEPLKGSRKGQWSRRITHKHRLIYEIHEEVVAVLLLAAWGHYDDK
jgi:toxin-antitoxin system, toxin component, Txe/YoeB family